MQNQLVKIQSQNINNQQTNTVSARELHSALELKTEFTNWTKQFMDEFNEGVDFIRIEGKLNPTNNVPIIEYLFTIDMAKQVAMLARTARGKEVRLYFIECEKKLKQYVPNITRKELALMVIAQEEEIERLQTERDNAVDIAYKVENSLLVQAAVLESLADHARDIVEYYPMRKRSKKVK